MPEVSLKDGAVWRGMADASTMEPSLGTWAVAEGVYFSKDGSEIRTFPGSAELGRPFLGEPFRFTVDAVGPPARITTKAHWDVSAAANHQGQAGSDAIKVFISGSDKGLDGVHDATRVDDDTLDLTGATATGTGNDAGYIWVQRVNLVHGLFNVDNRCVVVAETKQYSASGATLNRGIGSWVVGLFRGRLGFDTTTEPERPKAGLAEQGFVYWPCPPMADDPTNSFSQEWTSAVRRAYGAVLNGRLCLAVPGWGVMFQVYVRREETPLLHSGNEGGTMKVSDHRRTKALGIPRGVMIGASISNEIDPYPSLFDAGEHVYAAIGYFDPFTGEVGLPSEIIKTNDATSTAKQLKLEFFAPRAALSEAWGLGIIIYLSEPDAASSAGMFPWLVTTLRFTQADTSHLLDDAVKGANDNSRFNMTNLFLQNQRDPDSDNALFPKRFPVLEQMPPGAGWVVAAKGRIVVGGDIGLTHVGAVKLANRRATSGNKFWILIDHKGVTGTKQEARAFHYVLPSSYAGHQYTIDDNTDDTYGLVSGTLEKVLSDFTDWDTCVWLFDRELPGDSVTQKNGFLHLLPNLVRYSEEGFPGVMPATNTIHLDTIEGRRTTAAGRIGDVLLIFSDRSTVALRWAQAPRGQGKRILSEHYGCIAHGSVVEIPEFGLAWLSQEGPCVWRGGSVEWIGKAIYEWWKTALRDNENLMPHSLGVFDRERRMVIWTLIVDAYDSTSDEGTKSKSTTDRLLCWHVDTGNFSYVKRGSGTSGSVARVSAIGNIVCNDGDTRVSFINGADDSNTAHSGYYKVYGFDDRYVDRLQTPLTFTANSDRDPSNAENFDTGSAVTTVAIDDYAFIRTPHGDLRWWGQLATPSGNNVVLKSGDEPGSTWKTGDVLEAHTLYARLESNRLRMPDLRKDAILRGLNVRCDLVQDSAASYQVYAWMRVRVRDETGTVTSLCRNKWGDPISDGITQFQHGRVRAEDAELLIDVISNVQVRIKDLTLELE